MRIDPISAYRFAPIRPLRKVSKSQSSSKTKSSSKVRESKDIDNEGILFDDLLELAIEDADSSQEYMQYKEPFTEVNEGFGAKSFIEQLAQAQEIAAYYDTLPNFTNYKKLIFYQSFKPLSLPEALVYYAIIHENLPQSFQVELNLAITPHWKKPLTLNLCFKSSNLTLFNWTLLFDFNTGISTVFEKNKQIAWMRFIIRDQRLEEIDGHFKNKPFIIDPVWSPHIRGELKHEYITFNEKRYDLLYKENEKYSVWKTAKEERSFKQKDTVLKRDSRRILTQKKVEFSPYQGKMRLIYVKGILMPVCGQFVFKTT